jgi:hypothetical protein
MKLIGLTVAGALAFTSCSRPTTAAQMTEMPAPPAEVPSVPIAVATPPPVPAVPVDVATSPPVIPEPAAPAPPELAPEGVFYVIVATRVETESGVHGLPPGTGVKLVRPGIYLTPAGEMAIAPERLTNDMAVARAARNAAQAEQAALQQQGAANASVAAEQARMDAADVTVAHKDGLKTLDRERLEKNLAALQQQKVNMEAQVSLLVIKRNKEYDGRAMGRTVTSNAETQLIAARAQLKTIRDQITTATRQLRAFN